MPAITARQGLTRGLSSHSQGRGGSAVGKPVLQVLESYGFRHGYSVSDVTIPQDYTKMIDHASSLRLTHERCHCRTTDFKCVCLQSSSGLPFSRSCLPLHSFAVSSIPFFSPSGCRLTSLSSICLLVPQHLWILPTSWIFLLVTSQTRTRLRPVMELHWVCCLAVLFCVVANSKASAVVFQRSRASTLPDFLVPLSPGCRLLWDIELELFPFSPFPLRSCASLLSDLR